MGECWTDRTGWLKLSLSVAAFVLLCLLPLDAMAGSNYGDKDFAVRLPSAFLRFTEVATMGGETVANRMSSAINPASTAWLKLPGDMGIVLAPYYSPVLFDNGTNMHVIGESATVTVGSFGVIQPTISQIRTNDATMRNGRTFDYTVDSYQVQWGKRFGKYAAGAMFNFAAGLGYDRGNPAKGVKKFKEQSRDRFMRADEIKAFFASLADEVDPWPDLFTLALLTGARKSNVLAMKWADLELKRGLWKISEAESKNKEPLVCILHPTAAGILQRRAEANADKAKPSEYVFPSWGKAGHITETKTAWARIIKRAKIKNLRLHDLRRTLGSWQAATGASLSIIGRSLGHKNIATTAVYARLDLDPVRASVNMAGDRILACLPAEADNGEKGK